MVCNIPLFCPFMLKTVSLSWFIMHVWYILFLLTSPQIYFQSPTTCRLCHSSFLTYSLVGETTWNDNYRVRELFKGVGVTPHTEGNDGPWDGRERPNCKIEIEVRFGLFSSFVGKNCDLWVCQQSPDFGGKPKEVPHSVYFQKGGQTFWTSGSQARKTLPERASANVCTPSKQ